MLSTISDTSPIHDVVGFHLIAIDEDSPWSQRGREERAIYKAAIEALRADHQAGRLDIDQLTTDVTAELNGHGIGDQGYYYKLSTARQLARKVAALVAAA